MKVSSLFVNTDGGCGRGDVKPAWSFPAVALLVDASGIQQQLHARHIN